MIKQIVFFSFFLAFFTASPKVMAESEEQYLNFLSEKMVKDFHAGIALYNEKKSSDLPQIIRNKKDENYSFMANKNRVRFTILNYLNDQIYINDRLKKIPAESIEQKTSLLSLIIQEANAEEDLDAGSTALILKALGEMSGKLDEVGFTCVMESCQKKTRDKNMAKILSTLKNQKEDCENRQGEVGASLEDFKRSQSTDSFIITLTTEFNSVKEFMRKISNSNAKSVESFMEDKLARPKNSGTCMTILLRGTKVDKHLITWYAKGGHAGYSEEEKSIIQNASQACQMMSDLKSCVQTLQGQMTTMNNEKRKAKDNAIDTFPEVNKAFQTLSK